MLTAEQMEVRRSGVGASEAAAALGLSPYATPLRLYQLKRGEAPPDDENLAMRFGNAAESFILSEFERAHPGLPIVRAPDTMRRGPMLAHLDAWVPGQCNVQAKTARSRNGWGESGSPDVPQHYLIQVQAEMLLANVAVSYVPVLFGGADYDEFIVEADRELQDMIEAGIAEFWERVQAGEPPEPQTYADMIARYGRASRTDAVMAGADVLDALKHLRELKTQAQHLELAEEGWKAVVLKAMGECDTLVDPAGKTLATWKASAAPKRFDTAAFKAAHPDLYEQFVAVGEPSRRFLLK